MTIGWNEKQGSPHVTVNQMVLGHYTIDIAGVAVHEATEFEATYAQIKLTGNITAPFELQLPKTDNLTVIINATTGAGTVSVSVGEATSVSIPQAEAKQVGTSPGGDVYIVS